jgi:hypothetical protein
VLTSRFFVSDNDAHSVAPLPHQAPFDWVGTLFKYRQHFAEAERGKLEECSFDSGTNFWRRRQRALTIEGGRAGDVYVPGEKLDHESIVLASLQRR